MGEVSRFKKAYFISSRNMWALSDPVTDYKKQQNKWRTHTSHSHEVIIWISGSQSSMWGGITRSTHISNNKNGPQGPTSDLLIVDLAGRESGAQTSLLQEKIWPYSYCTHPGS